MAEKRALYVVRAGKIENRGLPKARRILKGGLDFLEPVVASIALEHEGHEGHLVYDGRYGHIAETAAEIANLLRGRNMLGGEPELGDAFYFLERARNFKHDPRVLLEYEVSPLGLDPAGDHFMVGVLAATPYIRLCRSLGVQAANVDFVSIEYPTTADAADV